MRLIIYILLLLVGWQPLAWAGASSVETNLSVEKDASTATEKKSRKALRLKKSPKKSKLQQNGDNFSTIAWIFSILSLLAMVGFGLGFGLGISWLLWVSFGWFVFYPLFGFIRLLANGDWDDLFLIMIAALTMAIFGLEAIVLGLVFAVVWVWVVGLSFFVVFSGFLIAVISLFNGVRAPRF